MSNLFSFFKRRDARRHYERLLTPHLPHLYRLSYRFTGKREDAEDLVQDLLIHLFPKIDEMRSIVNLKPWLCRCLYNRYIDSRRKAARDPLGYLGDDQALLEGMEHSDKPDMACYQTQVFRLLEQLGDKDRVVVNLHDVEGYSIKEIEALIDMPVGTIKSRLHRARKRLRESLDMQPSYAPKRVTSVSTTGEQYEL
jgi:RNA polymerase sigma factor (sigma-70 family)